MKAQHYPLPLPVIASTVNEKALFLVQKSVISVIDLAKQADVTSSASDRWATARRWCRTASSANAEMRALMKAGAAARSSAGHSRRGQPDRGPPNDRVASVALDQPAERLVIAVAMASCSRPRR